MANRLSADREFDRQTLISLLVAIRYLTENSGKQETIDYLQSESDRLKKRIDSYEYDDEVSQRIRNLQTRFNKIYQTGND